MINKFLRTLMGCFIGIVMYYTRGNYFINTNKQLVLSLLLLCGINNLTAQDFDNYQLLENQGALPDAFLTSTSQKYQEQIGLIDGNTQKRERKDRQLFYLESNFSIDNLIRSGKVLFNDPLSAYVEEVGNVLLRNIPFADKMNFYVIRSAAVNAFATNNGDIFVTMGLLAKLENEAQLAFILSHELVHVRKKHALNFYLESKEIDRDNKQGGILQQTTFDDNILRKSAHSKEIEMEADELGLALYQKTPYDMAAVESAFQVLRNASLPFREIPFNRSFFEDQYVSFPENYFLDETNPTPVFVDKENSSHPDIKQRIAALSPKLKVNGGKKFIVSKFRFEKLKKTAQFETLHLQLREHKYSLAIYNAYILLLENPESLYLRKIVAKALAAMTKFRNDNQETLITYEAVGESKQVDKLINSMSDPELNALALRYAWLLKRAYPEDAEMALMTEDIFQELVNNHFLELKDLSRTPRPENRGTATEKSQAQLTESFARYAFVDLLKDPDFVDEYDERINTRELGFHRENFYNSLEGSKELSRRNQRRQKRGFRLGIDRVVIVDPLYLKIDVRQENMLLYEESEEAQKYFADLLALNAQYAGLEATILNKSTLAKNEMATFNDIIDLNEWMNEQDEFENLDLQSVQQHNINKLAKKYNTKYFVWTGVFSLREENSAAMYSMLYSLFFPPYLPFSTYTLVKGKFDMLYFCIVYDVKEGRYYTVKYEFINKEDTRTILNSQAYDAFYQIKAKDRRKIE